MNIFINDINHIDGQTDSWDSVLVASVLEQNNETVAPYPAGICTPLSINDNETVTLNASYQKQNHTNINIYIQTIDNEDAQNNLISALSELNENSSSSPIIVVVQEGNALLSDNYPSCRVICCEHGHSNNLTDLRNISPENFSSLQNQLLDEIKYFAQMNLAISNIVKYIDVNKDVKSHPLTRADGLFHGRGMKKSTKVEAAKELLSLIKERKDISTMRDNKAFQSGNLSQIYKHAQKKQSNTILINHISPVKRANKR